MFGREGERETSWRQWQISKQMYQGGDLGSPRIKDVHHCLIIATKQDVVSRPLSSPNSGCKNNWEQFLLSDGLRLLWVHPGTAEPFTIEVNAPNPKDPDASEMTSTSAGGDMPGKSQKLTPFHEDKKVCHHSMSRQNSWFKRMGWSRLRKQHNKSIIRCKKIRPGQTTLAVCCRWPINDSSCPRLHNLLEHHCWTIWQATSNLSVGSLAICVTKSNSMPKTTITEEGPTHLRGCRGKPRVRQTCLAMLRYRIEHKGGN